MLTKQFLVLSLLALVSSANSINGDDECIPKQLYSALGNSYYYVSQPLENSNLENNDAIIMFATKPQCKDSFVELTDSSGVTVAIKPWEVVNFTGNYTNGQYQNFIHFFYLFELMQDQEYHYRAVSPSGNRSLPHAIAQKKSNSSRHLVIGDWDYTNFTLPTWKILDQLINETTYKDYSHILFLGDMAYDLEHDAGNRGDVFFEKLSQSIGRYLPYMVIPGNHEKAFNYSNFANRIRTPLWEETNNHYYSYNTGLIHWVTFDFNFYTANPSLAPQMLKWLAEDLKIANENRNQWPWIVFMNHRPIYCSNLNEKDCNDNANTYSQIETILYENSVDLYLSGHVHSYERMLPIYKHQVARFDTRNPDGKYEYIVNAEAPVHIVEAIGGSSEDGELSAWPHLDYSVMVEVKLGYGILNCHNETHLEYTHVRSVDNKTVDHMFLIKDRKAYSHDMIE